ncbi:MAG: hypothetical protein WA639_21405 [Candidatus Acidiferrum sp.]
MIKKRLKSIYAGIRRKAEHHTESILLLQGKEMAWRVASLPPNTDFRKVGFRVFSQFDEDGIIQYLINGLPIKNKTFIEFGVENYEESNTRFLLLNDHWQGMVLDARASDIRYIQQDKIYWQYDLQAKCTWITRENINTLLSDAGFGSDVGLLSIDIDGNDYWIWEAIQSVRPLIVIVEYNSLFGLQPIAVPYKEDFDRTSAHYSNLYYGASLGALQHLAHKKGYLPVGSNVLGHNAFFLRSDIAGEFRGLELREAYIESRFRESRDENGQLNYLRGIGRMKPIQELPVVDVVTGETGKLKDLWAAP